MPNPTFSNSLILPENLPTLSDQIFNAIDPSYLKLIYIRLLVFVVFGILIGLLLFLIATETMPLLIYWIWGATVLLTSLWVGIISRISFPHRGYLIREKDIAYQRGLVSYKLTSIPFKRIQHVELIQGVLAKRMGLATIKVYTAGGSSDDLSIPGLSEETARQIREFLTDKISLDE